MNQNIIENQEIAIGYICELLNIDITNKFIFMDIANELNKIIDLSAFIIFIKNRFTYERYKYLTGIQKFTSLLIDYNKEYIKLDPEKEYQCEIYGDKIFDIVTTILDEIYFVISSKGLNIKSVNIIKTLEKNNLQDYQIRVLSKINEKTNLLNFIPYKKELLKEEIRTTIIKMAIEKAYPHLRIESKKEKEINIIRKIKEKANFY